MKNNSEYCEKIEEKSDVLYQGLVLGDHLLFSKSSVAQAIKSIKIMPSKKTVWGQNVLFSAILIVFVKVSAYSRLLLKNCYI